VDDCNHKISNLISDEARHRAGDESFINLASADIQRGLPENKSAKISLSS